VSGRPPAFVYPPIVAWATLVWSKLPYLEGLFAWRVLALLLGWLAAWAWWEAACERRPGDHARGWRRLLVILALSWCFEPLIYGVRLGQSSPLVFALIALALLAAKRGREYLAGILLALAAVIKIWPAVFGLVFLL